MKKSLLTIALLLMAGIAGLAAQPQTAQKPEGLLSLKGLDPVMLVKGKEVKGDENLSTDAQGCGIA